MRLGELVEFVAVVADHVIAEPITWQVEVRQGDIASSKPCAGTVRLHVRGSDSRNRPYAAAVAFTTLEAAAVRGGFGPVAEVKIRRAYRVVRRALENEAP